MRRGCENGNATAVASPWLKHASVTYWPHASPCPLAYCRIVQSAKVLERGHYSHSLILMALRTLSIEADNATLPLKSPSAATFLFLSHGADCIFALFALVLLLNLV